MENKKNKSNIFNMKYFNVILYMSLFRFYNTYRNSLLYTIQQTVSLFRSFSFKKNWEEKNHFEPMCSSKGIKNKCTCILCI